MKQSSSLKWTHKLEDAANLVADGRLSDEKIAATVSCSRSQLVRWKRHPEFAARVEENVQFYRKSLRRRGLALKERRLLEYIDEHEAIERIRKERSELYKDFPGGDSGYMVVEKKCVAGRIVDHVRFDPTLISESLKIRKQIAIELGEWPGKPAEPSRRDSDAMESDVTGPDANSIRALGPETLKQILQLIQEAEKPEEAS